MALIWSDRLRRMLWKVTLSIEIGEADTITDPETRQVFCCRPERRLVLQWLEIYLGFAHGRCVISSAVTCSGKLGEVDMCEASTQTFDHHAPEASGMIRFVPRASITDAKSRSHQICKHMKASGLIPLAATFLLPLKNQPLLLRCLYYREIRSKLPCSLYFVSLRSLPQLCDIERPWKQTLAGQTV